MPDLRKIYKAVPGAPEGAKLPGTWGIAQGLIVTPNQPFGWNQFTTHLTIEQWDVAGQLKRIKKFHLSFKLWKGKPMSGRGLKQPGCTWEWNSARSMFAFKGWFEVPFLYLKDGEDATVATKTNEFTRKYVTDLLIDKFMWAALEDAPAPT
jgi:hypothetical protein